MSLRTERRFTAHIDPCNRVWIEDAEKGRHPADGGMRAAFPQSASKRKAAEYLAIAEMMAAAPETARALEAERALNRELVDMLRRVLTETESEGFTTLYQAYIDQYGKAYKGDQFCMAVRALLAKAEGREKGDG